MAAGKIEAEHHSESVNPLIRTTFTTCGPFSFIRQTKQILEEVEEKKQSLYENIALELRSTKTSEFYDVIDSLPGNEEVFEVLRIKQLVRDSIQTADREIQDLLKQQLKNDSEKSDFVPSETAGSESDTKPKMLPSSTTLQSPSSSSLLHPKQNLKNKPVKSTSMKNFAATRRKPMSDPKKKSECGLKGSHRPFSSSSHMMNQQSGCAPQGNKKGFSSGLCALEEQEQSADAQYMRTTSEVSSPRKAPLFQKYKSTVAHNLNIRSLGISGGTGIFSDKNKYFPSAVPLGPPSRQKSVEKASDFLNEMEVFHNDAAPNLTKRSNVAVVTVQCHEVNQKNLTCQALPSISIEGKSKVSGYQKNNVKNILFQEEISETDDAFQHPENSGETEHASFAVDTVENKHQEEDGNFNLKHSLNDAGHTDKRPNTRILCQVKEPTGSPKTPEHCLELEEEISRDILENLILDVVHEDLWNVCCEIRKSCQLSFLKSSTSPPNEKEVYDAETQVQNSLVELVDQEIQAAAEHPELISEYVQTVLSEEPSEAVSAGIQVSQTLEKDLENELPPVTEARAVTDVSVQTSLELRDESNTEHKSPPEPQNRVLLANNDVALDSNLSSPNVAAQQHAQDVKLSPPSQIENEKSLDDAQTNSGATVPSSHRTDVVEPDEMASEHDVMQSDLDVLPQKEQRSVPVQKMSDSEPSLSERTNGLTVSASTTISDSDFLEGLISEGECILQSHLRLLSLLGKETTTGNFKRKQEKEAGESSLSEGEIPTRNLNALGDSHAKFSTTTLTGGSAVAINSMRNHKKEASENSLSDGEIPVRNLYKLVNDSHKSSLSEGEIPVRNLNRLTDNQRNLPVITLTGHFEETVPVKLTAEKPSTSSNNNFSYCASSWSEGEIYPHYNECSRKPRSHQFVPSGANQITSAEKDNERGICTHPPVFHLEPNPIQHYNPPHSKYDDQNTTCDAHLRTQDDNSNSLSYDVSSWTKLPKSSALQFIPCRRNSTKGNVAEYQSQATTSLPQVMYEVRGFHSSHDVNARNNEFLSVPESDSN